MDNSIKNENARQGPPMPTFLFKVMNPLMAALLTSPFHKGVSKNLMVLTFSGRRSGKRYSTPVGYLQEGNQLIVFTHSDWWKNLRGGAPVEVRLRGKIRHGKAEIIRDEDQISKIVQSLTNARGEEYARRMGFNQDNPEGTKTDLSAATQGTTFIAIDLAQESE